jgi:hypothetical protein
MNANIRPLFNETDEVLGITSLSLDSEAVIENFGTLTYDNRMKLFEHQNIS